MRYLYEIAANIGEEQWYTVSQKCTNFETV